MIIRRAPVTYHWLHYHDREWLNKNKPTPRTRIPLLPGGDKKTKESEQTDARWANTVRHATQGLYTAAGRPQRVTREALYLAVPGLRNLIQYSTAMPLTKQAVTDVCETGEACAVRRIRWVMDQYRGEGSIPSRWQVIQRASVYWYISRGSQVVKDALANLD